VALLGGLVVVCAARPLIDRFVPEPRSAADDIGRTAQRLAFGADGTASVARAAGRLGLAGLVVIVAGAGIVVAGTPARAETRQRPAVALDRLPRQVDPDTFPAITVDADVTDWNHEIEGPGAREILVVLAENLELENQALLSRDETILPAVDHGDRLAEMQSRLQEASSSGQIIVPHYQFDDVTVRLIEPFGVQSGLSLGLESRGTVTLETYGADGGLRDRTTSPFAQTFVLRRATGDRWLNVGVLPAAPPD
jgi:hypothetical protein